MLSEFKTPLFFNVCWRSQSNDLGLSSQTFAMFVLFFSNGVSKAFYSFCLAIAWLLIQTENNMWEWRWTITLRRSPSIFSLSSFHSTLFRIIARNRTFGHFDWFGRRSPKKNHIAPLTRYGWIQPFSNDLTLKVLKLSIHFRNINVNYVVNTIT